MYPYCLNFDDEAEARYEAEEKNMPVAPAFPNPGSRQPIPDNRRPRPDDYKPWHDDRRPGHDDRRPGHDDRRPGHDDRRPGYDDRRPGHDDRRPGHRPPPEPWTQPGNYPPGEPPVFIPERPVMAGPGVFAVDPGAIYGCLNNYTYIWLANGLSFWMYITYVGRQSVAGYRWARFGWTYTGLDLQSIESFSCARLY